MTDDPRTRSLSPDGRRLTGWRGIAVDAGAVIAGISLLAVYVRMGRGIPTGASEFVFWPPLEPLPYAPLRGFTWEQLHRILARWLALGPALLALSWPARRLFPSRRPSERVERAIVIAVCVASLLGATVLLYGLLNDRALVDDELTYRQQAEILASGRLAEDTVPPWAPEPFTIVTPIGSTGKYLFGEPLVQTIGLRLGTAPAVIHLAFLALTLVCWFELMRREASTEVALWSTGLLALSPTVVLNTATGCTPATSLFCAVAGGLGLSWIRGLPTAAGEGGARGRRASPVPRELWSGALLLGGAVGFLATVRPQVALPVGGVLGLFGFVSLVRRRRLGPLLLLCGTVGCFALAIAYYNAQLTGSPLRLPWDLYFPSEHFGFGLVSPESSPYRHTPIKALENLVVVAIRFDGWWLGWPSSLLLPLVGWWVLGRPASGARVWALAALALVAFNFAYYSPGVPGTGPVYYHELTLLFAALFGAAVAAAFRRAPKVTAAVLVVHFVLGTGSFWVEHVKRLERFVDLAHRPIEEMLRGIEPPALLLYETAPQEAITLGWLYNIFPKRYRSDDDPIVTYPRGNAESQAALRARYPERACWYYRVDPSRMAPELSRCEDVEALLERPGRIDGPPLVLQPTALRKGAITLERAGAGPQAAPRGP